jgi:hypothetical protein
MFNYSESFECLSTTFMINYVCAGFRRRSFIAVKGPGYRIRYSKLLHARRSKVPTLVWASGFSLSIPGQISFGASQPSVKWALAIFPRV